MIRVGCSGWSYSDWEGVFYPRTNNDRLTYYSHFFNTVEINSTFYSIPSEKMVQGWLRKIRNEKNFTFSIKLPRELSHDLVIRNPERAVSYLEAFSSSVIHPIYAENRLSAVLLQLPPYFSTEHMDNLVKLGRKMADDPFHYWVEFRNKNLYDNQEEYNRLMEIGLGIVTIDSPEAKISHIMGKGEAYVRLHGRNMAEWFNKNSDKMEKYDYLYTSEEIREISSLIGEKANEFRDIYIYFNNHPSGKAPRNAVDLMKLLNLPLNHQMHDSLDTYQN